MPPTPKSSKKNENYEVLNLIGYGLAKFDIDLVRQFGFSTKSAFYQYLVKEQIGETIGTIKNRQDIFDPFFPLSKRKGWWQSGSKYLHRKEFIDSLFGDLDAERYSEMIKLYMRDKLGVAKDIEIKATPILRSRFKQVQLTGQEAEQYFLSNYESIEPLKGGRIEDARLFGDGYDFQIEVSERYILAEIKGVQLKAGAIRFTEKEYRTARDYSTDYALVIVSNLGDVPRMKFLPNPISELTFRRHASMTETVTYHSESNGAYLSSRRSRPTALQCLKERLFFGGRPASAAVACKCVLK